MTAEEEERESPIFRSRRNKLDLHSAPVVGQDRICQTVAGQASLKR